LTSKPEAIVFGVASSDHVAPFQRSTNVAPFAFPRTLPNESPTAAQAFADAHETPLSSASSRVRSIGVPWISHRDPFQRSTTGRSGPLPRRSDPTMKQALGDAHDTPLNVARGAGLRWIDHLDPFQRCTSARTAPDGVVSVPTATHTRSLVHDTATSELDCEPVGTTACSSLHLEPFQRTAYAASTKLPGGNHPTAVHADLAVQDTAIRSPSATNGTGTDVIAHCAADAVCTPETLRTSAVQATPQQAIPGNPIQARRQSS
jgi:hypothetical protein